MRQQRALTETYSLPGGQERLREAILYVAKQCQSAALFGAIKLNKILWKADFDAFAERGLPVTGRPYTRQKLGPVPKELVPVRNEMLRDGLIRIDERPFSADKVEQRVIALSEPRMGLFSEADLAFLDRSIRHYWNKTGMESSDESHGVAWNTRSNGAPMFYELAFLAEGRPRRGQWDRLRAMVGDRRLISK